MSRERVRYVIAVATTNEQPTANSPQSTINNLQSTIGWARLLLIVALLLGLVLRLGFVLHGQDIGGSPLMLDEGNYVGSALPLAQGHDIPDRWLWERPPLYIFFAAAVFAIFGSSGTGNLLALGLAQTALSLLAIWLVWLIARLLFPARPLAAALAALLVAVSPSLAFYANMYMTETLYITLLLAWFYITLRWQQYNTSQGGPPPVPTNVGGAQSNARQGERQFASTDGEQGEINPTPTNANPTTQNSKLKTQNYFFVLSAVTFAGGALTRSLLLLFLPLLLVWMVWRGRANLRRALAQAALYAALVFVLILPWSIRNTVHYDHFILIDTTGQINLYIDNGPLTRSGAYDRLGQIANLGDRADFAQREALATMFADPGRFGGTAAGRLHDTWRADPFTEFQAFIATKYPSTSGSTELTYSLAGGFYHLLFFSLAIVGLVFARGEGAAKALALPLIAMHTLTTLLAHPEYRYLLPFLTLLAPWAGWVLAALFQPRCWTTALRLRGARRRAMLAALAITLLFYSSASVLGGYAAGGKAAYHLVRAQLSHFAADARGEASQLEATLANFDAADLRVRLADIRRTQGHIDVATSLYQQALASDPHYWHAALNLGAAKRASGDLAGAKVAFNQIEPGDRARAQDWAWAHLDWDLRGQISVGVADYGYVRGFFEPEQADGHTYRWSGDNAAIHLYTTTLAATLTLTLRASSAGQRLSISINGQPAADYQPILPWQQLDIAIPAALRNAHDYQVQLAVDAKQPLAQDPRRLGVAVDGAMVH